MEPTTEISIHQSQGDSKYKPMKIGRKVPRGKMARMRGTALVEFGAMATVLLMMIYGVMDFGRALYCYHAIDNAAKEGTRYAIVRGSACTTFSSACPASASDIQTYVKTLPLGLDPSLTTVTISWSPNNNPGSTVKVQVQYSFNFDLPFLPKTTLPMSTTSQMVISE